MKIRFESSEHELVLCSGIYLLVVSDLMKRKTLEELWNCGSAVLSLA
jgi:hypothetical protein